MARYRKKPVVIDATQWFPGSGISGVREVDVPLGLQENGVTRNGIIKTLEGDMVARPGDWIITGIKGEKYPCKPDIFEATYEVV